MDAPARPALDSWWPVRARWTTWTGHDCGEDVARGQRTRRGGQACPLRLTSAMLWSARYARRPGALVPSLFLTCKVRADTSGRIGRGPSRERACRGPASPKGGHAPWLRHALAATCCATEPGFDSESGRFAPAPERARRPPSTQVRLHRASAVSSSPRTGGAALDSIFAPGGGLPSLRRIDGGTEWPRRQRLCMPGLACLPWTQRSE